MRQAGYQPEWRDGREHGVGWRDASGRYEAIKRYLVARQSRTDLRQFDAPTVLDVGAYNGYFCRRLADDFRADAVAVDGQPFLEDYRSPSGGRVTAVHKILTPADIRNRTDWTDIVLCLSVLHHWPNWFDYLTAMSQLASTLFIEIAHPAEHLSNDARAIASACWGEITMTHAELLAWTAPMNGHRGAERPLYAIETRKAYVDVRKYPGRAPAPVRTPDLLPGQDHPDL
jgi:Methyltransferase domain